MIAIAVQTIISLMLCFAIGFVTAWIIRGGREERRFQTFFEGWRSRYDRLEQDCDAHLSRINSLQKELSITPAKQNGMPAVDTTTESSEKSTQ